MVISNEVSTSVTVCLSYDSIERYFIVFEMNIIVELLMSQKMFPWPLFVNLDLFIS